MAGSPATSCVDDAPPRAFTRWEYLVVPLSAAGVTSVEAPGLERLGRSLLAFDVAGLGLFYVAGILRARKPAWPR